MANAERPMILVGNTVLQGQEGAATHQVVADMSQKLKSSKKVDKEWKVLNVLHRVCVHPWIYTLSQIIKVRSDIYISFKTNLSAASLFCG